MSTSGTTPPGSSPTSSPSLPPSSRSADSAGGDPLQPTAASGRDPLRGSRASGVWVAVVALVILLVLLAIFVLQNTRPVEVSYFAWDGQAPLAATLLIASATGMLIAVAAGSLRILQLRHRVRREQKR